MNYRVRKQKLIEDGLTPSAATEVALGEKFLVDVVNAQSVNELRLVLGMVLIKQWGLGRAPDNLYRSYEESLRRQVKEPAMGSTDCRIAQLEQNTSPHKLAGYD